MRVPIVSALPNVLSQYDAAIVSLGFETRSRFIPQVLKSDAREKFAVAFPQQRELAFEANREWFARNGYDIIEENGEGFAHWLLKTISRLRISEASQIRVQIDISSMSRVRIAHAVNACLHYEGSEVLEVDYVYAIADYSPPSTSVAPNTHVGPVIPDFAGWTLFPERPPIAITGLGYEQDRALGAVEYLQATHVWAFVPQSGIPAYEPAVMASNRALLERVGPRIMFYDVENPVDAFKVLELLTFGCLEEGNPILLPFGPKIFALICMLVAALHDQVSVWRVSGEVGEAAVDRRASGRVVGLRVRYEPPLV